MEDPKTPGQNNIAINKGNRNTPTNSSTKHKLSPGKKGSSPESKKNNPATNTNTELKESDLDTLDLRELMKISIKNSNTMITQMNVFMKEIREENKQTKQDLKDVKESLEFSNKRIDDVEGGHAISEV